MPRYNWPRVGWRITFALLLGLLIIFAAHSNGKSPWPPRSTCQGGIPEAFLYEIQFVISLLAVEAIHWIAWFLRQKPRAATHQSVPTGGKLFAPRDAVSSVGLALFLLYVTRFLGIATPCETMTLGQIGGKVVAGQMLQAYAVLLLANLPWKNRRP